MSNPTNGGISRKMSGSNILDFENIYATLTTLVDRLDSAPVSGTDVIPWGCPVPSFGDLSTSKVATLGLNPSNREFMDESGNELHGPLRRFHTLNSLGLKSWSDADSRHLRLILETCRSYFFGNPYHAWFKKLELVVTGAKASYYDASLPACHLDLIPYATACKWTALTAQQRSTLLTIARDTLGLLIRSSPVDILILNGKTVVDQFQDISGAQLERIEMPAWSLPRQSKSDVTGFAYRGIVDTLSGIKLGRNVLVLGYNHNLQGSFGVSTKVILQIRGWIARATKEATQ